MQRPEEKKGMGPFSQLFLFYCLETGPLFEPEAAVSALLSGQGGFQICLNLPVYVGSNRMHK